MSPVSFQTIKLSKGKHVSPDDGACVMELASMLAGEQFSDRPASVCPVIGAFLRAYNDILDDERRQELYACAARVVGSRASGRVETARAERLATWAGTVERRKWTRFLLPPHRVAVPTSGPGLDVLGERAARALLERSQQSGQGAVRLVDELLSIGDGWRKRRGDVPQTTTVDDVVNAAH